VYTFKTLDGIYIKLACSVSFCKISFVVVSCRLLYGESVGEFIIIIAKPSANSKIRRLCARIYSLREYLYNPKMDPFRENFSARIYIPLQYFISYLRQQNNHYLFVIAYIKRNIIHLCNIQSFAILTDAYM